MSPKSRQGKVDDPERGKLKVTKVNGLFAVSWAVYLDEIHFEWFEKIKDQRNFTAAMTQFPISIMLNYIIFEPFKMDLVLA